ncbi:aldo/keto reductase [Brevibacillus laterosporus]|uniref:aldo/keto reductase n=1 Tax=Brevibacillus laterosporus TaxID=1465 RepID=UPI000E6B92D7|nr:aldo/keto reductase [Brevibacillus laterosporus]AYB39508.1 aldo/keto reductase [Brevibacillus laterosporus]MBG9802975.1 general stress protein [Brevibacillus laterosporus]MBM7108996.1 General stress protein 69 [Brevibacillus laterosporus]MED4764143.1 aldo/keto reductase [Brevibacillus laterosporus]NKQ20434.1 aldo/keto reductase [Brevibacillus laterosporus]
MDYVQLGSSELKCSRIGLGTWAIGGWAWGGTNEKDAIQAIQRAFDIGINTLDTAPVYGFGLSEEICGKAIKEYGQRDKIHIATKAGIEWVGEEGVYWCNASKERVLQEFEDSLRRLQVDYIDLYQLHWPDPGLPVEETADIFAQLYKEGKIRAIGVSNFSIEQIEQWRKVAPLHSSQTRLNVLQTEHKDTFRYCFENNINTLTWGTLAQGLLTGKFTKDSTFAEDDLRHGYPLFAAEYFDQYLQAVDRLKVIAQEKGKTMAQLAVRWTLDHPGVSVSLWGARKPAQLDEVSGVMGWTLSAQDLDQIDQIIKESLHDPFHDPTMGPPTKEEWQEMGVL